MPNENTAVEEVEETEIIEIAEDTEGNNRAAAFVNWSVENDDGSVALRSTKGFRIFNNSKYPNRAEEILVKLAEKNGGNVEMTMKVRVVLNQTVAAEDFDLDSIPTS